MKGTNVVYSMIHSRVTTQHDIHLHVQHISSLSIFTDSLLQYYKTELQRQTVEFAGLSASRREELEDLLMEGDLLEVKVEEVQQLWQLLTSNADYQVAFEQVQTVANRAVLGLRGTRFSKTTTVHQLSEHIHSYAPASVDRNPLHLMVPIHAIYITVKLEGIRVSFQLVTATLLCL